jgi:hypothetical protein
MTDEADRLADMLERAVSWVDSANEDVKRWENVRKAARKDIPRASDVEDAEERKFWAYKADAESHMADVGTTASREIQTAAMEELGRLQREFFVTEIEVSEPNDDGSATATAILRPGRKIPNGYQFYWRAGGADVMAEHLDDDEWKSVIINANELPTGDTTVEAILGKTTATPVQDFKPDHA